MAFETTKKRTLAQLGKPDRSKQGNVDEQAWPMINTINDLEGFYTTSSCAGRISIFKEPASGKKHEADWLYVTHDNADLQEITKTLTTLPQETVWLRMESPIFHIACKDQQSAQWLVKTCHEAGWKRAGIISNTKERAMVEFIGSERIDAPIATNAELLIGEKYLKFLVDKANKRLKSSRKKLEELRKKIISCAPKRLLQE